MRLDLDLLTHELLTDPNVKTSDEIRAGSHFIRDGNATPNGHPEGAPVRVARDRISGDYYARIDGGSDRRAVKNQSLAKKAHHVPGLGFWVPLHLVAPDHPHVTEFKPEKELSQQDKAIIAKRRAAAAKQSALEAAKAAQQAANEAEDLMREANLYESQPA